MTQRILKYEVPAYGRHFSMAAQDFVPLCVQMQNGKPCLWAVVTAVGEVKSLLVNLTVLGTGHEFDLDQVGRYVGTFQQDGFVGHVFCEVVK